MNVYQANVLRLPRWMHIKGGQIMRLHGQLREEGLSYEEATKVVKEEIEIQALEVKGMTRSDAQGIVECRQRNEGSKQ